MTYKEMLQKRFELTDRELSIVTEETAETIMCYITACGYENFRGLVYPHVRHHWELTGPNGTTADIFFDPDNDEVLLVECPGEERFRLDSQTKFNHKLRVDYIKAPVKKGILYTRGYDRVDYVEEPDLRPYFKSFHCYDELKEDLATDTKLANQEEKDYEKLLWIKGLANQIRKEKQATRNPEL